MNLLTFRLKKSKRISFDDDDYYLFIFFNKFKSTEFDWLEFLWVRWKVSQHFQFVLANIHRATQSFPMKMEYIDIPYACFWLPFFSSWFCLYFFFVTLLLSLYIKIYEYIYF